MSLLNYTLDSGNVISKAQGLINLVGGASDKKTIEQKRADSEVIDWDNERKIGLSGGKAEVLVSRDMVILASDETTAVGIGDGSIMLIGKVHMSRAPSEIRVNGFWVFNEELLTTIPSTLFNPVQTLLYKAPPYAAKVSKFAKLMKAFGI
jgi:hypothetical protein